MSSFCRHPSRPKPTISCFITSLISNLICSFMARLYHHPWLSLPERRVWSGWRCLFPMVLKVGLVLLLSAESHPCYACFCSEGLRNYGFYNLLQCNEQEEAEGKETRGKWSKCFSEPWRKSKFQENCFFFFFSVWVFLLLGLYYIGWIVSGVERTFVQKISFSLCI